VKQLLFLLLLTLNLLSCFGQKFVKKSVVSQGTTSIQLDTSNFFEVQVGTTRENEIVLEATMEGEYEKDLGLEISEAGNTLMVSAAFQPHFVAPNDKLSAHKVISISLTVLIPENMDVSVYGTSANVFIEGQYKHLKVALNDGRCTIKEGGENVEATTQSGPISLEIASGTILAETKYGSIDKQYVPVGNDQYSLHSTTGNISIRQSK